MLFTARVDLSGCEVMVGADKEQPTLLTNAQQASLRRSLWLNEHSMLASLFSELCIILLRFRRLVLALRYLAYLISPRRLLRLLLHYARASTGLFRIVASHGAVIRA